MNWIDLAGVVAIGVVFITGSSLAFVSHLMKRRPQVGPDGVHPFHDRDAPCRICGQKTNYLSAKASGNTLRWSCPLCEGKWTARAWSDPGTEEQKGSVQ